MSGAAVILLLAGLACVGAGTVMVMAGTLARGLVRRWTREGTRIPEMQCIACGHRGLMGVLAPGKYCCAPCREEIWAEVEGRALPKPWQAPEALKLREIRQNTQAELARRLVAQNIGSYTVYDCRPDQLTQFVPLAQALKERV